MVERTLSGQSINSEQHNQTVISITDKREVEVQTLTFQEQFEEIKLMIKSKLVI